MKGSIAMTAVLAYDQMLVNETGYRKAIDWQSSKVAVART